MIDGPEFTDGSKLNEETVAGIYSEFFSHYFALNSDTTGV